MKKFAEEFKTFIMRGNVLDMAVGVVVATAFGKITTALINNILMPFIAYLFGARDMTALNIVVREAVVNAEGVEEAAAIVEEVLAEVEASGEVPATDELSQTVAAISLCCVWRHGYGIHH